jgi:hypothetical protein
MNTRNSLILIVLGILFQPAKAQELGEFRDKGFRVDVDLERSVLMRGNHLGFQLDELVYPILENDTQLLGHFRDLRPQLMRFPSGHLANFLLPSDTGLGFSLSALDLKDSVIRKDLSRFTNLQDEHRILNRLSQFIARDSLQLIFVANIYTGDTSDLRRQLELLRSLGVDVLGVELGFEIYRKTYHHKLKLKDYLEKARSFTEVIKSIDEEIQVAVCASPMKKYLLEDGHPLGELGRWNDKIAKEDFYDAVSLVVKQDFRKCFKKGNLERNVACSLDELIEFAYEELGEYMTDFEEIFEKRKFVWISSFGFTGSAELFDNTFMESQFVYDFIKNVAEYNMGDSGLVNYCFYDKTYSPETVSSLFTRKSLVEKEVRNKQEVYRRAAYYPLQFLSGVHNQIVFKLNATGASNIPVLLKTKQVNFIGFYAPETKTAHFYVANKTNLPLRLDMINFKGKLKYRRSKGKIDVQILTASEFQSSMGVSRFTNEENIYENSEFYLQTRDVTQPKNFVVPSKSIYYIAIVIKR